MNSMYLAFRKQKKHVLGWFPSFFRYVFIDILCIVASILDLFWHPFGINFCVFRWLCFLGFSAYLLNRFWIRTGTHFDTPLASNSMSLGACLFDYLGDGFWARFWSKMDTFLVSILVPFLLFGICFWSILIFNHVQQITADRSRWHQVAADSTR